MRKTSAPTAGETKPDTVVENGTVDQVQPDAVPPGVANVEVGPATGAALADVARLTAERDEAYKALTFHGERAEKAEAKVTELEATISDLIQQKSDLVQKVADAESRARAAEAKAKDFETADREAPPAEANLRKLILVDGERHVSGRTSPPTVFESSPKDRRPHAWVRPELGEHLIDTEPGKYAWDTVR